MQRVVNLLLVGGSRVVNPRFLSSSSALKRQQKAEKKQKEKAEKQAVLQTEANEVSPNHMTVT